MYDLILSLNMSLLWTEPALNWTFIESILFTRFLKRTDQKWYLILLEIHSYGKNEDMFW